MSRQKAPPTEAIPEAKTEGQSDDAPLHLDLDYLRAILNLDRRISGALQHGREIRLSLSELDVLVLSGACATLSQAAAEAVKEIALRRLAERRAQNR